MFGRKMERKMDKLIRKDKGESACGPPEGTVVCRKPLPGLPGKNTAAARRGSRKKFSFINLSYTSSVVKPGKIIFFASC